MERSHRSTQSKTEGHRVKEAKDPTMEAKASGQKEGRESEDMNTLTGCLAQDGKEGRNGQKKQDWSSKPRWLIPKRTWLVVSMIKENKTSDLAAPRMTMLAS